MGWKLIDKPKTSKVTKALATRFAEMDPAPHDRPLSERRLTVYHKLLNAGQFRPVTWATAHCLETGGIYRVNGKHTSIMLSGLEVMPEFFVTVEDYVCDTLEDVAKLYATFDSAMMSRSARDIYLSFAATSEELRLISTNVIAVSASGLAFAIFGNQDMWNKSQPAERAELLLEHSDFVVWLSDLVSSGPSSADLGSRAKRRCPHMLRAAVVAAMFSTWKKSMAASNEFWTAVSDETGSDPKKPDRFLARYLLTTGSKSIHRDSKHKQAGNREIYVKCLHGWNAWRKNEITSLQYHPDKPVPTAR